MQASINIIPHHLDKKTALSIVHSLAKSSKMPCHSYSISAKICITGRSLRNVLNSVCSKCYALKGRYSFPNVQNALNKRAEAFDNPLFETAMVSLITHFKEDYFRWFDSGDLQNIAMLHKIANIAKRTPNTLHWLPTREYKIVDDYIDIYGSFPENLLVRVSSHLIDESAPKRFSHTSEVHNCTASPHAHSCPAPTQNNQCNNCRACWDTNVKTISYTEH